MTNSLLDSKTPILLWKHPTIASSFTLKIGKEQLIGFVRTDKKGASYWKFHQWGKVSELNQELAVMEKFQQRQEKSQLKEPDGKPTNSPNNNNSQ